MCVLEMKIKNLVRHFPDFTCAYNQEQVLTPTQYLTIL